MMRFLVVFVVLVGLLLGAIWLGAWTDSNSRLALEARAREAEAQAAAMEAQAAKLQAQAAVTEAEADLLLHDAAAYTVRKQAELVAYYAHRGWLSAVWLVSLALTALAVVLIVREWRKVKAR